MLQHAPLIRLSVFLGLLVALLVAERVWPRRGQVIAWRRWPGNLGLGVLGAVAVRLLAPAGAVGAAFWAEAQGWGLLPALGVPFWAALLVSVPLLDLLIYWQHRATHAIPLLWRLHRVHHADPELDASSALRFHPLEILLSLALKAAAVVALGAPPEAVLIFEVLLNATAMFNHANWRIPQPVERWLRLFVVTPDLHRTHHSVRREETDSCFGFCLPWWDWLFGTYRAQPIGGHAAMVLGIGAWGGPGDQRLDRLLVQPLAGAAPAEPGDIKPAT